MILDRKRKRRNEAARPLDDGGKMSNENEPRDPEDDEAWAELLSPGRRELILRTGLTAAALVTVGLPRVARAAPNAMAAAPVPPPPGKSPWGYETYKEATPRPPSVRPGEQVRPSVPRAYTDIKSYHAHIYFDEDTFDKAALIRRWVADRFVVELGNWNTAPRGPHVTPSFYFGFTNDLLPFVIPWLQLNSLGLTILVHPNTEDPRADHLYYALWVNRSQPVNAYDMRKPGPGEPPIEQIFPNTRPSVKIESA
jgi:DOPA 4,5-dioxygenase